MLTVGQTYTTYSILRDHSNCADRKRDTEDEFENYRSANYPNFPSRKECLYVCAADNVEYWERTLCVKDNNVISHSIFEIELTGRVFWADATYFTDGDSDKYWAGCVNTPDIMTREGLFRGDYTVLKKCQNAW